MKITIHKLSLVKNDVSPPRQYQPMRFSATAILLLFAAAVFCSFENDYFSASLNMTQASKLKLEAQVREILRKDYKGSHEDRMSLFESPWHSVVSAQATAMVANSTAEAYADFDEPFLLHLMENVFHPTFYLKKCNQRSHLGTMTKALVKRVLADEKLQTPKMLESLMENLLVQLPPHLQANIVFGGYAVPIASTTDIYVPLFDKLMSKSEVRDKFLVEFKEIVNVSSEFMHDYLTGRVDKLTLRSGPKSDDLRRKMFTHLLVLPRMLTQNAFWRLREELADAETFCIILDKIYLLKYYNPIAIFKKDQLPDNVDNMLVEFIIQNLSETDQFESLKNALLFSNPRLFLPILTEAGSVEQMEVIVAEKLSSELHSHATCSPQVVSLLMTRGHDCFGYSKRQWLKKPNIGELENITKAVFEFYEKNYELVDFQFMADFMTICPDHQQFIDICKWQPNDFYPIEAIFNRLATSYVDPQIYARLFDSMIVSRDDGKKTDFFGKFEARKVIAEWPSVDIGNRGLFDYILARITHTMMYDDEAALNARMAYCTANLADYNTSKLKLTIQQQKSNVFMFKIVPFLLSSSSFSQLRLISKAQDRYEIIYLLDLLAYHDPLHFNLDKKWEAPGVRQVSPTNLYTFTNLKSLKTGQNILRSILKSQPTSFSKMVSLKAISNYPALFERSFVFSLAQDFLTRINRGERIYDDKQDRVDDVIYAFDLLNDYSLFKYDVAALKKDRNMLIRFDIDFEAEFKKLLKQSDQDFTASVQLILSASKTPSQIAKTMISYMPKNAGKKKALLEKTTEQITSTGEDCRGDHF